MEVLDIAKVESLPKEKGSLLYAITTKVKTNQNSFLPAYVQMVTEGLWNRVM